MPQTNHGTKYPTNLVLFPATNFRAGLDQFVDSSIFIHEALGSIPTILAFFFRFPLVTLDKCRDDTFKVGLARLSFISFPLRYLDPILPLLRLLASF